MAIVIMLIIAFWFMYGYGVIPLALAVCMTVFGSLHCVISIIRAIVKACEKNQHKSRRTGNSLVDEALDRLDRFR